ncbi:hypothetical protein ACWA7J_11170 [Leptothrix sp. BB-4]
MPMSDQPISDAEPAFPLLLAAELQDHLLSAGNDLERLQRLLNDASEALMTSFYGANSSLSGLLHQAATLPHVDTHALHDAMQNLAAAVTALQFQDMASQLIHHTHHRLRSCADQLAREAMGGDDEGETVVEAPPVRPNPVTQDEMDAGSVELF